MRFSRILMIGLVACMLGAAGMAGCASSNDNIPVAAMPSGETFSGLWRTNFGDMKLTQNSDGTVKGTFDYKTGGEIEGTVEGGVLKFAWRQPGDFQVGRREVAGHGYLVITIVDDETVCKGEWGYVGNYTGGGDWHGTKAKEIYRKKDM